MIGYVIIIGILTLSLFLLITLFGELPQFQGSWIARLRKKLIELPRYVDRDGKIQERLLGTVKRFEKPARWVIPVGYILLITTCLWFFINDVYDRIDDTKWVQKSILIPMVMMLPYISTPLAVFKDPGVINKDNHKLVMKLFPYDSILFFKGNECNTCKRVKPARSKHCSTCNVCIAVMDHHCIWLNNCVGYSNAKWFLLFVFQNVVVLGYGFVLTRKIISNEANKLDGWFYTRWPSAVINNSKNKTAGCLMIMCFTLGMVAFAFFVEQMRYIWLGVTTNEICKWEDIGECIKDGDLYFYDHPSEFLRKQSHLKNEPTIVLQRGEQNEGEMLFNRQLTAEEQERIDIEQLKLEPLTDWNQINNIYDKGVKATFKQRFFPEPL